jgi:hypothetical protein
MSLHSLIALLFTYAVIAINYKLSSEKHGDIDQCNFTLYNLGITRGIFTKLGLSEILGI